MLLHQPRLVLPHLPRDLVDHGVDRRIHVVRLLTRFDRDVIRTDQNDLGRVAVFLHFEDDVRLDDLRIIEVQIFDLARDVVVDRVGDLQVAAGDFDRRVSIGCEHAFLSGYIRNRSPR